MGAVLAEPGYFKRIREICDCYGLLLILDEVMYGTHGDHVLLALPFILQDAEIADKLDRAIDRALKQSESGKAG